MAVRAQRAPAQAQRGAVQDPLVVFEVPNFDKGLHYDAPPVSIDDTAVQDSLNVLFDNHVIAKRAGYGMPFQSLGSSPVRLMDEFYDSTGKQWIIFVTDTKMWTYSTVSGTFVDITPTGGLNGGLPGPVSGVGFYGKYYVTNNIDKPFYWDGIATTATWLTTTGAPVRAISVSAFFNHLMWFNVNDPLLGVQPMEVVWSDNQNGLVYNSGDAGLVQLEDTNDFIVGTETIYSYLAIARDKSIYICEFIGFPFFYAFFRRVEKDGIIATNSFKKTSQFIMGLSKENVIGFDGSTESAFIGEPIRNDLFGGIIDPSAYYDLKGSTRALYDTSVARWRVWVSHRADGEPDTEYCYSTKHQNWSKHQYANAVTAIGTVSAQIFTRWNDPIPSTTAWKNRIVRWNAPASSPISPNIIYGDINGNIYMSAGKSYNDNGQPINAWFKTKAYEFHHPDWVKELQRIQFIFKAQSIGTLTVQVYASDDGVNFVQAPSSPLMVAMNGNPIAFCDCFATGQWFYITVTNANLNEYFEIWRIRFAYEPLYRRTVG